MSSIAFHIKGYFKKYVIDALSHMAFGLFCSLIMGLIIGQISKVPGLDSSRSYPRLCQPSPHSWEHVSALLSHMDWSVRLW